jgi:hypothetical protein
VSKKVLVSEATLDFINKELNEMHRQMDIVQVPRAGLEGFSMTLAQRLEFLVDAYTQLVLARCRTAE